MISSWFICNRWNLWYSRVVFFFNLGNLSPLNFDHWVFRSIIYPPTTTQYTHRSDSIKHRYQTVRINYPYPRKVLVHGGRAHPGTRCIFQKFSMRPPLILINQRIQCMCKAYSIITGKQPPLTVVTSQYNGSNRYPYLNFVFVVINAVAWGWMHTG